MQPSAVGQFLGLKDREPDAKTVWLYRAGLAQAGMVETLFKQGDGYLARQDYIGGANAAIALGMLQLHQICVRAKFVCLFTGLSRRFHKIG